MIRVSLIISLLLTLSVDVARSQWVVDGAPVTTADKAQTTPKLVSDGQGGAIITWSDNRNGSNIYAQRISSSGPNDKRFPEV